MGFSTDPTNPMRPLTTGADRIAPFYDFRPDRLDFVTSSQYYSYIDAYDVRRTMGVKRPYIYFGSGRMGNDYRNYSINCGGQYGSQLAYRAASSTGDVYYNPDSFQIICAGRDGYFGGGPYWTPGRPNAEGSPGYDDMTNFYDKKLGIAP